MEYKRVKPDRELLTATAPDDTVNIVFGDKYEICMIAAMEEGKLAGYAIFSHTRWEKKDAYLEYYYTVPDMREQGVCTGLIKYCRGYLAELGIGTILSKYFINPLNAIEYNKFMEGRGFIPINVTGRILVYKYGDLLDAGTIQTMMKFREKMPPVLGYEEAGEKVINAFLANSRETGFYFCKDEADPKYSKFYKSEDESINGVIVASKTAEDVLFISAIYMDEIAEKNNMFLSLLSECLSPLKDEPDNNNIKVIITLDDEAAYNGLGMVFNPPDEEYIILEHMIQLNRG